MAGLEQFALVPRVSQAGFSVASRPVSVLISALTGCRPVRCGYVQFLATRRRCHHRTVPGMTSRCARSVLGRCWLGAASTARSAQFHPGPGLSPAQDRDLAFVAYFNGGDAVHYFPRASYGSPRSLGCVELPRAAAQRAWPYLTYGSLVTVAG